MKSLALWSGAIALLVSTLLTAPMVAASPMTSSLSPRAFTIVQSDVSYDVDYWSNGSLASANPDVSSVVFMVHGNSRNADDYGRYTADAAKSAGRMGSTLVVAPHFIADDDSPSSRKLYWTSNSWKEGGTSVSRGREWSMSSFAVLDMMVTSARASFPTARIAIAGHSAGGQFVQRYVLGTRQRVADMYVPMNPGTYMYLDDQRWSGSTRRSLTSREKRSCSRWNDYKYGLANRTGDLAVSSSSEARELYSGANVSYLLGGSDTRRDSSLDTDCEADWQGRTRLSRGNNFFAALPQAMGGSAAVASHSKVIVSGVAHEGSKMIRSTQARPLLFP